MLITVFEFIAPYTDDIMYVSVIVLIVAILGEISLSHLRTEIKKRKFAENELKKKITELEKAKQDIESERDRLNGVLSSMGEALIVCDSQEQVLLMNQAAGALLRTAPKEAEGKKIDSLFSFSKGKASTTISAPKKLFSALRKSPDIFTVKTTDGILCKINSGQCFPISMVMAPFYGENRPDANGAILLFRDSTEEFEIDKAKTEFVSVASHQLRTPLTAISWYSEMFLNGDAGKHTKKQKEFVDQIHEGVQRMIKLVNALLDVSRLELGTFIVRPEKTNLLDIAHGVVAETSPRVHDKSLVLTTNFARLPRLNIDPNLTEIILQNLLSNAVKYTPEGGTVHFEIKKHRRMLGTHVRNEVIITVQDSGYGIAKEEQQKIFTKLFRASNAVEVTSEGTGLGLYICKTILDHAGGNIWFQSELGKGSTFYVTIPFDGMKEKKGIRELSS